MYGADEVELLPISAGGALPRILRAGAAGLPQALARDNPLVLVAGAEPLSDYGAQWPLLAHPNRFPNGTGGQPAGMTEAHWVQLQLRRWYPPDDHSGQAPHFVLDMFDRLQRHQVNDWVTQHLQIHPHLVERLQNMTYDQVLQALELLALGLRGQELADRVRAAPPIVADLVHGVRMSTSKVAGTAASAGSLRSRAYGLWVLYGPPTLSLTLNPSSINAEQFYQLCGAGYGFDADGKPIGRPAPGDRWQLVAGHPVSSAQCFDACMRAFFEIYAGWRFGELDQANPNCLFGRVDAYVHKPETNQRGELHAHPSLWQHAFHPTRLRPALAGWQRQTVLRFMESIQGQSFASPTLSGAVQPPEAHAPLQARPIRRGPPQPSSCACEQGRHRVHAECQHRPALAHLQDALQAVRRRVQDDAARTCQLPLSDADPDPERAALFAAEAALEVLVHDHLTGTCTPPSTPATDDNCRLRHPRALNWESAVDPATGCVHLKRYGCTLVAHIVSFLLALPCNHTVTFACEVSRVLRTQELWDRKHPTLPKTHPSRPRLLRIEAMAAELADYALKYNTKAEASEGAAGQLAAVLLLKMQQRGILVRTGRHLSPTIAVVAEAAQPPPGTAQEVQEAAERAAIDEQRAAAERAHAAPHQGYHTAHFQLAHACNVSTAQTTLPAPMAALALLNGQVYRESYHSQYIDYRLFSSALLPGSAAGIPEAPPVGVEFVPSKRDPSAAGPSQPLGVRIVTRHTDYLYRGPDLAHLSPMFLFMFYYKRRLHPGEDAPARPLHPQHPQASTHAWARRQHFAVPQPIGDAPVRPTSDAADPQARDVYAAFALGNFAAYSADAPLNLTGGLWAAYRRYFFGGDGAPSIELRVARHMLDNVDSLAVTRAHADERRLQLQRLDRDPLQEAEDALLEHVPGEEYGVEAAEEDDPAPSAPHRSSRPDNSLWSGLASAPEARSQLQATYLRPPRTVTGHSAKEEAYVNAALRQLPAPPSAGSGAAPHPSLHQQAVRDNRTLTRPVIQDILDEQARHEVLGPQRTEQQLMVLLD
ncbi:hypothetical protein GPECTOR_1123g396 [Gonium pectorale]|uniref:Helitron helicase-like domain-containing protein n=1 Tax=Gonium pectorale TaxID=33097 RepID=A0A150FTM2_GONPE|nr:hypothetical protein GPECTOR_1123g396 [Gonium pectorale]|eukprot:KXZ40964.1 hypothetical protein GPECTOR_1123g396 [Gonium pectorale]